MTKMFFFLHSHRPVALAASGMVAVLSVALLVFARPSAAASSTYTSTFGYQLTLPDGWRQSAKLSRVITGNTVHLGHDTFTVRSDQDESRLIAQFPETLGPEWQYVVVVEVYNNPTNLSASQWANTPLLAGWAKGQTVSSVTFDGKSAARITNGARYSVAYYVAVPGKMFLVGERADTPAWFPSGAQTSTLDGIVSSFHTTP